MTGVIWVDVEDLFQYARGHSRPSGIQRIEYELCRALAAMPETRDRVRFIRHLSTRNSFYVIPYAALDRLYGGITASPPVAANRAGKRGARVLRWRLRDPIKRAVYRLPETVRAPLIDVLIYQRKAILAALGAVRAAAGETRRLALRGLPAADGAEGEDFAGIAGPGDVLVALGAPWFHPAYASLVEKAQLECGVRFAMLVYDIIPLRRPEWFQPGLTSLFGAWAASMLPLADVLLTISRASAADLVRHAAATGIRLRAAPRPIPIGTGFAAPPDGADRHCRPLPPPGSYALIVATIEARKNHVLLFRVWRRLLDELPADSVPALVIAGRVGWLVDDLMNQLRNAAYLGGKIILFLDPTDGELSELYRGCRFTVFPSFYEGWGLPVTESLGFGRPCIISNTTSLPEAGGTLARYFDPDDSSQAYRVIRDTIADPAGLRAWQDRVIREFRPVTWVESARAIDHALAVREPAAAELASTG